MPELPAVEFTRRLIEEHCINQRIASVDFIGGMPDELIFTEAAADFVKNRLKGMKVGQVGRWGKQLFLIIEPKKGKRSIYDTDAESAFVSVLLIHLGMTGFIQFKGTDRLLYESSPSNSKREKDNVWPPKFLKFTFAFENGELMAFCDARRFGKVDFLSVPIDSDVISFLKQDLALGFDPLLDFPEYEEFCNLLAKEMKRKINVKTLLMEQKFVAGIGNWMADDILLLAGIKPSRSISSLKSIEVKKFHKAIREITLISVGAGAKKAEFPKGWLFHIRWQHGNETLTGLKVLKTKIGGRTTFWVPELQK